MPITGYSASEIAALIPGAHKSGSGYRAPCPAHDGTDANLSITDSHEGAIVTCFSHECDIALIKKALDIGDHPPSGRAAETVYDYLDCIR